MTAATRPELPPGWHVEEHVYDSYKWLISHPDIPGRRGFDSRAAAVEWCWMPDRVPSPGPWVEWADHLEHDLTRAIEQRDSARELATRRAQEIEGLHGWIRSAIGRHVLDGAERLRDGLCDLVDMCRVEPNAPVSCLADEIADLLNGEGQ